MQAKHIGPGYTSILPAEENTMHGLAVSLVAGEGGVDLLDVMPPLGCPRSHHAVVRLVYRGRGEELSRRLVIVP